MLTTTSTPPDLDRDHFNLDTTISGDDRTKGDDDDDDTIATAGSGNTKTT